MNQGVIVGIGSEWGVDRIGLDIAAALADEPYVGALGCRLYRCDAPARLLPTALRDAPWALLVDAVRSGRPLGSVWRVSLKDLKSDFGGASSHGIGVAATLELLAALNALPARMSIVGVEVGFEAQAVPKVWIESGCRVAIEELRRLSGKDPSDRRDRGFRSPYTDSSVDTSRAR